MACKSIKNVFYFYQFVLSFNDKLAGDSLIIFRMPSAFVSFLINQNEHYAIVYFIFLISAFNLASKE